MFFVLEATAANLFMANGVFHFELFRIVSSNRNKIVSNTLKVSSRVVASHVTDPKICCRLGSGHLTNVVVDRSPGLRPSPQSSGNFHA